MMAHWGVRWHWRIDAKGRRVRDAKGRAEGSRRAEGAQRSEANTLLKAPLFNPNWE